MLSNGTVYKSWSNFHGKQISTWKTKIRKRKKCLRIGNHIIIGNYFTLNVLPLQINTSYVPQRINVYVLHIFLQILTLGYLLEHNLHI